MYKPDSLRTFLAQANPELARDPERLLVFIDDGHLNATFAPGLSFEYAYTLQLVFTDFAGHPDAIMVPLLLWLRMHQPDLLANPGRRDALTFEADLLDNSKVDLEIRIPLTERVGVHPREGGGYDIEHYPEPPAPEPLTPGRWDVYLRDEHLGSWDAPLP